MYNMTNRSIIRKSVVGITLALTLVLSAVGVMNTHAQAPQTRTKPSLDKYGMLPIRPMTKYARKLHVAANGKLVDAAATTPPCLTNNTPPRCYSPQQIRNAYNIQPLLDAGITGAGETIVLIDFATSSTLQSDVHLYDQFYGLSDPTINVISPFSTPSTNNNYYAETALDVETAHSLAPDATIDLVLANVDNEANLTQFLPLALQATQYAVENNLGDIISQSFGLGESCAPNGYLDAEQQVFAEAQAQGITVLASSGDFGAAVATCTPSGLGGILYSVQRGDSLPAADPLVTAVGGTTLDATVDDGEYAGETAWNAGSNIDSASGGTILTSFPVPDYQQNISILRHRGIPDVAFDGDQSTGVPVVYSANGSTYIEPFGGTSVGSPAWAGIVALLNQKAGHRLGFLNPALYALSQNASSYGATFNDIRLGNNSVTGFGVKGAPIVVPGFSATDGWDPVTGLGSPIVDGLAAALTQ